MTSMAEEKYIAVDFDGTMVIDKFPEIGEENPYAVHVVKRFIRNGNKVILNTCRQGDKLDEAVEWMKQKGIDLYAVNDNPYARERWGGNDCKKVYADIYIDDHCVFVRKTDLNAVNWKYINRNYKRLIGE